MSSHLVESVAASLLRKEVLDLHAYHVPESAGFVKLDAMENPYGLPESVLEELQACIYQAPINRYPDPTGRALKQQISRILNLSDDMDILLGNGSDELIQLLVMALNKPNSTLLSVEPSFVMYKMIATFTGMNYVGVPLKTDFSLDTPAILAAIKQHQPALVFLAYPNNPTGNTFAAEDVQTIIEVATGLVVVDEAYYAFAEESFIPYLATYPNLLVMRTFSKLGMAGLRLGFIAGSKAWLQQLDKLRLPYNVGVLPQLVAEILLKHHDVLLQQAEQIKQARSQLSQQLAALTGVEVFESQANFILFRVNAASDVFNALKQHNILIKNLNGGHPMLVNCLRVTVGSEEENNQFINALREILK